MKAYKIIAILACTLCTGLFASAQPKSVGLRAGDGLEMSYQHKMGRVFYYEVDLGVLGAGNGSGNWEAYYPGMRLSASIDAVLFEKRGKLGAINLSLGAGVTAGLFDRSRPVAGFLLQTDLEYSFPRLPFALALDLRPNIWLGRAESPIVIEPHSLIPMGALRWKF